MPGEGIAPVALRQLAAWEDIAREWQVHADDRYIRCALCMTALWRIRDDAGNPYRYTDEQKLALTVAHLRQSHMDLDPDQPAVTP